MALNGSKKVDCRHGRLPVENSPLNIGEKPHYDVEEYFKFSGMNYLQDLTYDLNNRTVLQVCME